MSAPSENSIGYRLDIFLKKQFPDVKSQRKRSELFGFPNTSVVDWISNKTFISGEACRKLLLLGCDLKWLLNGSKESVPSPNVARSRGPVPFVVHARSFPVIGRAAADESQGQRAGFFLDDPERQWDPVTIPETTCMVEIIGNSMSPVLLNGQYALLGPMHTPPFDQPRNYDIVVADVRVKDEEQEGSDRRWEGVYCKRIIDASDVWVFLSINATGVPFTIAKTNCQTWPVVGVWFAGKGEPPED